MKMKRKSLKRELVAQFYRGNRAAFLIAVFAALAGVEKTVRELESARLSEIWKEMNENEAQIAEA